MPGGFTVLPGDAMARLSSEESGEGLTGPTPFYKPWQTTNFTIPTLGFVNGVVQRCRWIVDTAHYTTSGALTVDIVSFSPATVAGTYEWRFRLADAGDGMGIDSANAYAYQTLSVSHTVANGGAGTNPTWHFSRKTLVPALTTNRLAYFELERTLTGTLAAPVYFALAVIRFP
jgi:hypothetical protein